MSRFLVSLLLLWGPLASSTGAVILAPPTYCAIGVIPDYLLIVSYKAVLRLDPDCPPGGVARVRKASTINRWAGYRPIKPNGSATYGGVWSWTMTRDSTNVPAPELWTSLSWRWEFWDGLTWLPARRL